NRHYANLTLPLVLLCTHYTNSPVIYAHRTCTIVSVSSCYLSCNGVPYLFFSVMSFIGNYRMNRNSYRLMKESIILRKVKVTLILSVTTSLNRDSIKAYLRTRSSARLNGPGMPASYHEN